MRTKPNGLKRAYANVLSALPGMEMHSDGSVARHRNTSDDFATLFEAHSKSMREETELCALFRELDRKLVEGEERDVFKFGIVLLEAKCGIDSVDRNYLAMGPNNGLIDHVPLHPWEEAAVSLAHHLLDKVADNLFVNRIDAELADSVIRSLIPFIPMEAEEQLHLYEVRAPVLRRIHEDRKIRKED